MKKDMDLIIIIFMSPLSWYSNPANTVGYLLKCIFFLFGFKKTLH